MFYAKKIKPGEVVSLSPADGGEILHVSQVCMAKPTDNAKTYLQVIRDGEAFNACALQRDKIESTNVDFFLGTRQKIKLRTDGGKNEVHVIGYFEPYEESDGYSDEEEMMADDESLESDLEFQNEERIEELDSDEDSHHDSKKNLKKKLAQNRKSIGIRQDEKSSEEDESEDGRDDAEESDNDKGDDEDGDGSTGVVRRRVEESSKKRKSPQSSNGAKKGKSISASTESKDPSENEYEKSLTDYLKKHGPTPLSTLGQKVKKPSKVEMKMSQFIKNRGGVFKVDEGTCSLLK